MVWWVGGAEKLRAHTAVAGSSFACSWQASDTKHSERHRLVTCDPCIQTAVSLVSSSNGQLEAMLPCLSRARLGSRVSVNCVEMCIIVLMRSRSGSGPHKQASRKFMLAMAAMEAMRQFRLAKLDVTCIK